MREWFRLRDLFYVILVIVVSVTVARFGAGNKLCFEVVRNSYWLNVLRDPSTGNSKFLYDFPMQGNTADFVVLAADISDRSLLAPLPDNFDRSKLEVLLVKRGVGTEPPAMRGLYSTPGGFMEPTDETFDETATRELEEEAGLGSIRPTQMFVASKLGRDPRYPSDIGVRVISVYYGAIVSKSHLPPRLAPTENAQKDEVAGLRWHRLDQLPEKMAFDHKENLLASLELMLDKRRSEFVVQAPLPG